MNLYELHIIAAICYWVGVAGCAGVFILPDKKWSKWFSRVCMALMVIGLGICIVVKGKY